MIHEPSKKPESSDELIQFALKSTVPSVSKLAQAASGTLRDVVPPESSYIVVTRISITVVIGGIFLCTNFLAISLVWYFGHQEVELLQRFLQRPTPDPALFADVVKSRVVTSGVLLALIAATFAQAATAFGSLCYWLYVEGAKRPTHAGRPPHSVQQERESTADLAQK